MVFRVVERKMYLNHDGFKTKMIGLNLNLINIWLLCFGSRGSCQI